MTNQAPQRPSRQRYRGAQVNKENLYELADALGLDEEVLRKKSFTTPQLVSLLVVQAQILSGMAREKDNASG